MYICLLNGVFIPAAIITFIIDSPNFRAIRSNWKKKSALNSLLLVILENLDNDERQNRISLLFLLNFLYDL